MALPNNTLQDREKQSFVECNARPDVATKAVHICNDSTEPVPVEQVGLGTSVKLYNVNVGVTEVSQALSADTKRFSIRCRGNATLYLAYISGETTTNYLTIGPGVDYEEINLNVTGLTLYIRSSKAGQVAEVVEWT